MVGAIWGEGVKERCSSIWEGRAIDKEAMNCTQFLRKRPRSQIHSSKEVKGKHVFGNLVLKMLRFPENFQDTSDEIVIY